MRKTLDYLAATTLVVPALLIIWFAVRGYCEFATLPNKRDGYVFDFLGLMMIEAPWSYLCALIGACLVLLSGVAIVRLSKGKLGAWFAGFSVLLILGMVRDIP